MLQDVGLKERHLEAAAAASLVEPELRTSEWRGWALRCGADQVTAATALQRTASLTALASHRLVLRDALEPLRLAARS